MMFALLRRIAFCLVLACLLLPGRSHAETMIQFYTTPWSGFAPAVVQCGQAFSVNVNATGDTVVPISVPSLINGGGSYYIDKIILANASVSLTTAQAGFFTAASAGGVAIVSNGALSTLTAAALNAAGSAYAPPIAATTEALNLSQIYFNVGTAQGAAATMDLRVYCRPAYGSPSLPH